jgi:hypothetical protein
MLFYGKPINCKFPLTGNYSPEDSVEELASLFISEGFAKRTFFTVNLVSGLVLKCPGAILAIRDLRIKVEGSNVVVIGYSKDISLVLQKNGLIP